MPPESFSVHLRLLRKSLVLGGIALVVSCDPIVDAHYRGEREDCRDDIVVTGGEEVPDPQDCDSEILEYGTLCSTCTDGTYECLRAYCYPVGDSTGDCLECIDPRGRSALDCRLSYDGYNQGFGRSDAFSSCITTYGDERGSQSACHYPGPDTCLFQEPCIDCALPTQFGEIFACYQDYEVPPDPLCTRPEDLPAPGVCVEQMSPDGLVACTTCTRRDLSATTVCDHPPAESCESQDDGCMRCTHADGSSATICDPPRW
jgi:hypothetical protein